MGMMRKVNFGKISWNDNYFRINSCENIETTEIKDYHQYYNWEDITQQIDRLEERGDFNDIKNALPEQILEICYWYFAEKAKIFL